MSGRIFGLGLIGLFPVVLLLACDSNSSGGAAAEPRNFMLAATGVQMTPGEPLLFQKHEITGASQLGDDVDVLSIHNDFYGIPWDDFGDAEPTALPQPWVDVMEDLATYAHNQQRPVFLTLQLVHGPGRIHLADRTVIDEGVLTREEAWSEACYNFDTAGDGDERRAQYLSYVEWMMTTFEPQWVNVAVEVNAFWYNCDDDAWNALVDVVNDAHDRAKTVNGEVSVMYSVILSHGYGLEDGEEIGDFPGDDYTVALAALEDIQADVLGVSDYPYLHEDVDAPADIPEGWFTRIGDDLDLPVIIAETGWSATPLVAEWTDHPSGDDCVQAFDSTPAMQRDYLDYLVALAESEGIALVTWWSGRDLVISDMMGSCPVCNGIEGTSWCGVVQAWRGLAGGNEQQAFLNEANLKMWGAMGIRDYDGEPRQPVFDRWQEIRERPVAP